MNSQYFFTFSCILFFSLNVQSFSVLNSTYLVKKGTVLGTDFELATIDTQFDEDVYLLTADYWCPPLPPQCTKKTKRSTAGGCPPCDFSERGAKCGKSPKAGCSCDPAQVALFCSETPPVIELANGGDLLDPGFYNWTQVPIDGSPYYENIPLLANRYYRFYVDDPCVQIRVVATEILGGDPDIYLASVSSMLNQSNQYLWVENLYGPDEVDVCPPITEPGTFFLKIKSYISFNDWAQGPGDTSMQLNIYLTTPPPAVPPPPPCKQILPTHKCLNDGELIYQKYDPINDPIHYTITLPKANPKLKPINGSCAQLINVTIQVQGGVEYGPIFTISQTQTMPPIYWGTGIPAANGTEFREFQYRTAFAQCLKLDSEITYYMSVTNYYLYQIPVITLIFTTNANFRLTKLTDLYPVTIPYHLTSTSYLNCSGSVLFFMGFYVSARQDGRYYGPIYPADDPCPFWPRPTYTFGEDLFQGVNYVANLTASRSNKLSTYAIFNYHVPNGASTDFYPSSRFGECTINFEGPLTNSQGVPFLGTVPLIEDKLPCDEKAAFHVQDEMNVIFDKIDSASFHHDILTYAYTLDGLGISSAFVRCQTKLDNRLNDTLFVDVIPNTTTCFADSGDPEYYTDSCCSTNLQWEQSCVPRNVALNVSDFSLLPGSTEQCLTTDCGQSFLQDFISTQRAIDDPSKGCESTLGSVPHREFEIPYFVCLMQTHGPNVSEGIPCFVDDDCPQDKCTSLLTIVSPI